MRGLLNLVIDEPPTVSNSPWRIRGDLMLFCVLERIGSFHFDFNATLGFSSCISTLSLLDMVFFECIFIFCNNRKGPARPRVRLDHVFLIKLLYFFPLPGLIVWPKHIWIAFQSSYLFFFSFIWACFFL